MGNKDNAVLQGNTDMLVLKLLGKKDMYGYEIRKTLSEQSDHLFELREGTLYPLLHQLEEKQYVTSYSQKAENGKERKYYHITREGLNYLMKKQKEWEERTAAINNIMKSFRLNVSELWDYL